MSIIFLYIKLPISQNGQVSCLFLKIWAGILVPARPLLGEVLGEEFYTYYCYMAQKYNFGSGKKGMVLPDADTFVS